MAGDDRRTEFWDRLKRAAESPRADFRPDPDEPEPELLHRGQRGGGKTAERMLQEDVAGYARRLTKDRVFGPPKILAVGHMDRELLLLGLKELRLNPQVKAAPAALMEIDALAARLEAL